MSVRPLDARDGRLREALVELQAAIQSRYPDARFIISHPEDEPTSTELTVILDIDDPDEALDIVINRVVDLQVNEGVPIHVVPIRTPERVAADRRRTNGRGGRTRRRLMLAEAVRQAGVALNRA